MKRSIVKMVTVIVLVCLMTVVTYVPSFAGERIYVSDLYYLYPRYLSTKNEAVKTCYSDAQEVLSSVSDADKWIMIGQTILSDPEYIIGETLASLGIDQSVEEEAMEDAAKKLIEEMSNSPGIAKKAAKESADAKQAFKYIETTSDWAKFILEMSTKDVPGSVIKEVMKDDSAWETLGGISEVIGSADEIMRFAATIELCEIIRMEEMDYLIDILDEDLAAPIIKYKSYVESNYATYITETYIQEHVIDEVIKVKNFIKLYEGEGFGFSAAYSLVKSTCSIIAKLDNCITGVGSSKDLLKASMLGNYVEVLDYNHRDLFEDITNGPVYYDDIKKFELNYEVYLASIKAFADSIKSVDKNYEDLMDENINAIKEYNIEDYYEDVKSAIKADDKDNRKVMTARPDSFYDFNDSDKIISIEGPTDEMEPETIYTGNGKVYFSIKTNKGVDFQCDAELQDLTITGKGNIAIDGNPNISIRNLIGSNDLTVEPETQKTLAVTNIVNHRIMSFKNVQLHVSNNICSDVTSYADADAFNNYLSLQNCSASIDGDLALNSYGSIRIDDSSVDVNNNIKAKGYALGGLSVNSGADIHVNGDIEIKGEGERNSWYGIYHYCTFNGGTIELKGDLLDLTDYSEYGELNVYGWIAYDDFHLKLIGDKAHTIKVQKTGRNEGQYGGVGILEVDSPEIIVDGHLRMTRLDTDLNVNSSVETFSIKEPVEGKRIFIAGSVAIENAGMKNGLELSESSTLSIQDDLTATLGLRVLGGSQLTVGGEYIQECSQYEYGTVYIAENSTAAFGKSVTINDYSEFGVEDAVVTIAQDIKAEGYALGGLAVYDDAEIHVNGDIEITGKGEYDNWYNRHHYCTFKSGTIELKGDLKDLTDYQDENPTVYAWIASDDFHLKLTGDRVQTIKVQRTGNSYDDIYGGMGMLEVTSPGIELMGVLAASSLESNLLIKDSDVTTITINNWNNKTVTITNTNIIPNTNLPADYGMMVSSNENAYSIIFEPSTNETYYVKYSIDGTVVKTTSQYEAGSLAWPYEMLTDSSDEYIWFKDTDMTQEWSMKTDTITEDTYLYGIDAESFQCKHDYQEVEGSAVAATCTKDGKEADQKCSRCNDVIKGAVIEKLGHNYKEVEGSAVDATCTKDGKEVDRKCSRCNDVIEGAVIEKLGHDWDEGVVTTEPGCEMSGVKTFTCKNDATHTKTEPIDPIGHDWGDWEAAEPSTCVKEGQEVRICKHDSTHKDYRKAALLAHQLTHVDGVAATCEEGGSKEHWICSACGGIFSDAEGTTQITEADLPITPLGHAYGEWAPLDENQHQRVCTNDQKHTETAAHVWDAGVVTKEATETDTGETTFTCSICKAIRTETIPMIDKDPITPSDAAADQAIVDKSIPTVNTGKSKTTANIKKKQMTVKFPVEDAVDNYRIQYRLAGKSKWTNAWSAGTDTYVIKGLKKASLCEFRIAGYVKQADGSWARGKWSKSAYRYMGTVSLKAVKSNKKKQLTVTWAKDAKSTGYQIQYSLKSNMKSAKTVTVNGKAKTKATIRGLKSGKKYYVKVRPIKKASGKTYIGSLSKVKPAKIR